MFIIVLINIAIIICIYLRYYHFSKDISNAKEEIKQIDPMVMGFINDRKFNNNYDLILAEIVNLNIKKYIIIEYDKEDVSKYNYKIIQNIYMEKDNIEKYDLILLNFLFSQKSELTRIELEEKIIDSFSSSNIQYNQLQQVLQEKLIEQYIIDVEKKEELNKFSKLHKKISIVLIALLFVFIIFMNVNISIRTLLIYIFEILVARILFLKASRYTCKGEVIRNNIIRYKNQIKNKEFLINKKEMNEILLEKEFADTIALHINTDAKQVFINDIFKKTKSITKKVLVKLFVIGIIILVFAMALRKITLSMDRNGIILLYAILAIIVASSADIVYALGISKKQK